MTEIILGPPGCGKTTSLLDIVDQELNRGVSPDKIAFLSFTRRAAEEAVTRACAKFSLTSDQLPHFRTLHSMAFRQLGLSSAEVFEGKKVREFAERIGLRVTGKGWDHEDGVWVGQSEGDRMLHLENMARIRCVTLQQQYNAHDDGLFWGDVKRVAADLAAFKRENGLLDFTDMLDSWVSGGARPVLEVLVVDEAQDLSNLQWRMVRELARNVRRFVVAGDDDQAIYRWAGADVDALVDMEGDVRVLGQSYRVPAAVQGLAGAIIGPVAHRRPKTWAARQEAGAVRRTGGLEQVDWVGVWADDVQPILVLARNTYVLREHAEPALRRAGVPYAWGDHPALDPGVLSSIVTWERLREGGTALVEAVRPVYALMSSAHVRRGCRDLKGAEGELNIEELEKSHGLRTRAIWHRAMDRLPPEDVDYILAARQRGEKVLDRPRVRLSTIHGAKGGEARHVVLMSEMARRTYVEMRENPDDERRVWYTGVTRARECLTLVESTRPEMCPWV